MSSPLDKLKKEIEELLANESGRIDASMFKNKYKEHFSKTLEFPKAAGTKKLLVFLERHMNDTVHVTKKRSTNFIETKTKNKVVGPAKPEQNTTGNKGCINGTEKDVETTGEVPLISLTPRQQSRCQQNCQNVLGKKQMNTLDNREDFPPLTGQPPKHSSDSTWDQPYQRQIKTPSTSMSVAYLVQDSTAAQTAGRAQPKLDVTTEAVHIIKEISKENYVHVDTVKKRLLGRFQAKDARALGYRKIDDILPIKELVRKQREVNASIHAFVMVHSVSTLCDLSRYLTNLYSEAHEFEDLRIGPLVKQPLVFDYFKFPPNQEPPDITVLKVMKYLRQYMTKNDLWHTKVRLEEFIQYFTDQMNCSTPYELGVRIESVALMISSIKRCCSHEASTRRDAEAKLKDEVANEIEQFVEKNKKRLLGSHPDPDSLVHTLLNLSPVDIITRLFEFCCTANFLGKKVKKKVESFVETCNSDKTCRKLFQLALQQACGDLVKPVSDSTYAVNGHIYNEVAANVTKVERVPHPPTKDKLLKEVKRWLGKSSKSFDFKCLARIEGHVLNQFKDFHAFQELGHGTFLEFLSSEKELLALMSLPNQTTDGALGTVRTCDVIELIKQCGVESDKTKILDTLRAQYSPNKTIDIMVLDALIEKARGSQGNQHGLTVKVTLEACCARVSLAPPKVADTAGKRSNEHVGSLGYQDMKTALQCLCRTPLLEEYRSWSNWDNVFAPTYGHLKDFLGSTKDIPNDVLSASYPGDLIAMETTSGRLLRVTRQTSPEQFLRCAKDGDIVGTSGHLVSLVLHHGGCERAPLALLGTLMKDALLLLTTSSDRNADVYVVKFVIKCLQRIPNLMRLSLAKQIFIEPLQNVLGHTNAPGLILEHCVTDKEKSMVYDLGVCLGIVEWQEGFKTRLERLLSTEVVTSKDEDMNDFKDQKSLETQSKELVTKNDKEEIEGEIGDEKSCTDEPDSVVPEESSELKIDLSEVEQRCRNVIESIRRDEFGIGIELPPEHRQMIENQRSREGRGLHRLSSELYSKDTHFVLELVQNADDNAYSEKSDGDPPSIAFFINTEKIVVLNNEVGFEEKNIRALCDVGKSTKGKQRYGYIGQKGIGFKSVFRVTDTPEVHSNGYHVKFDAKSGPTGYILPHWCGGSEKVDEDTSWTTRIVLMLKDEMKTGQKKTLVARFHDIQPSLLLFLRRLRQIKITDEVSNTAREMFRQDLGDNLIELKHSNGADLWFVVKKLLPASNMKPDIDTTEIALAFPLPKTKTDSSVSLDDVARHIHGKCFSQQPVFAFLPLRSYGFRFIVQADFDVPSSREDVDKDSAWNQWLREEISILFVEAFDKFKNHSCFTGVASIAQLLQFIPLEDEILDFFRPVTTTILDGIRRKKCIPVRSKVSSTNDFFLDFADKDEKPNASEHLTVDEDATSEPWVFPSQVVVAEDRLVEELISDTVLNSYLGKYYLHPELQPLLNPPLCRVLGIEVLSSSHLIDIGEAISSNVVPKLDAGQSMEFCCWIAKWLCAVHRCLERERDCSEETLQVVASLKLYPLSDGHFTALTGVDVFLPLEKDVQGEHTSTKRSKKAAEFVHRDLRSLHPMILSSLDDICRPQVRKLLESMQVRCLTSRDLIKHHIIPSLKQVEQKKINKTSDVLCSYIIYMKEQWDLDKTICDLEELRSCVLLLTNKDFVNPNKQPVHFTVQYGNKVDLQKQFPSVSWILIDNRYLESLQGKFVSTWETFFSELGVVHFLAVERKDCCLDKSQLLKSVWSSLGEFWPLLTVNGSYTVKDYASKELEELLSSHSSEKELKNLIELLDKTWDEKYAKYAEVPYLDEKGNILGQTYSSFFISLKENQWVPSRYGVDSSDVARRRAAEVFVNDGEIVELLGNHAWYVNAHLSNKKFLKALGIQQNVSFDTLVGLFMRWVKESQDENESTFETSLRHMWMVYEFMANNIKDSEKLKYLEDVFRNSKVIFVPKDTTNAANMDAILTGQFVAAKDVCWYDPSALITTSSSALAANEPRRMLSECYPNLQHFFVNFLKIDETPNLNEYASLMESVAGQSSIASELLIDQMMKVYLVVAEKCMDDDQKAQFIKRKLTRLRVLPTTEEIWVSLEDKPLFSDDKSLEKLFREKGDNSTTREDNMGVAAGEKMHFLKMGLQKVKKQKDRKEMKRIEEGNARIREKVHLFFENVCGIRNLSECVSQEIISKQISPCYNLQLFLHRHIPYVQRFLYYKDTDRHDKHQESGIADALARITCLQTSDLEVVHRVSTHPTITKSTRKSCAVEEKDGILSVYVTDGFLRDINGLIEELAMFFASPGTMADMNNFLSALVPRQDDQIEHFMEKQGLDVLPDDIQLWEIHEPKKVASPILPSMPDFNACTEDIAREDIGDERRPMANTEDDGEPRGLQSWPPRSAAVPPQGVVGKNPATEEALAMWPPPPAPIDEYKAEATTRPVIVGQDLNPRSDITTSEQVAPARHEQPIRPEQTEQRESVGNPAINTNAPFPDVGTRSLPVAPGVTANSGLQERVLPRLQTLRDVEALLEEVKLGSSIERPEMPSLVQSANAEEIGRWGEECVYLLLQKLEEGKRVVEWLNKDVERALPYDIVIKDQDVEVAFVEVKSTSSAEKCLLEISSQEINCAFVKRGEFYLYRVYNAGNASDFRVKWLRDLATNLDCKAVKLFIRI